MSLRLNKEGYYIIDSLDKLKQWHRMTDLSHVEKLKLKAEFKRDLPEIKKNSIEKQKVVKNTVKLKPKKEIIKPEETAFDKWFKK